tara:strand:+ start:1123 stop:2385 length:1263 start_codon:yes stop_codon:yes gene_type:complete
MSPPLPGASKKSPRVYRNLETKNLENVTFQNIKDTGDPISIEMHNEDEIRRLVLVNLCRLTTSSEWTGLLTGGGSGGMTSFDLSADTGSSETVTNGNTVKIAGGTGIDTAVGPVDTVTVTNTGVTSVTGGPNITVSSSTGAVTISGNPTRQFNLEADSGATQIVPTDGTGTLSIDGGTGISTATGGANDQVVVTNTGVTSLTAGTNITLSGSTGAVTITAAGGSSGYTVPLPNVQWDNTYNQFQVSHMAPYACSQSSAGATYTVNTRPTAFPFIAPFDGDIDKGFISTSSAASSGTKIVIGIYDAATTNYPGNKIAAIEFAGDVTGIQTGVPAFTQTTELVAGNLYFYVMWVHSGSNPTLTALDETACLGFGPTFGINGQQPTGVRGANLTTGTSLPSSFGTTGSGPNPYNRPKFAITKA